MPQPLNVFAENLYKVPNDMSLPLPCLYSCRNPFEAENMIKMSRRSSTQLSQMTLTDGNTTSSGSLHTEAKSQ